MKTCVVKVGPVLIGGDNPIVPQTMLNTHTSDIEATLAQAVRVADAGAQLIRITVPALSDVECLAEIRRRFRAMGYDTPLVADVHFSSEIAIASAKVVEKVRINPGNFHPDHQKARERFAEFLQVCKEHGTAIRVGLNHGSLGRYIVDQYGNTPHAMALAAMEWVRMCIEADFYNVVVSLKASNTVVMISAYRELAAMMQREGVVFPLHVGVTEAGNGDTGRIKSCVAISTLLAEGIGNTVRVSLTEAPENEVPVAQYLAHRYSDAPAPSGLSEREEIILKAACDYGKPLIDREMDEVSFPDLPFGNYLADELMQACRRRFYKPEYIACPGCGRTMYNLQEAFEAVKARTSHLQNVVIAVMGCIVNGPGEMADADYGYVGEGAGKVTLYKGKEPVLRHIPEAEAVDKLVALIEEDRK
ncbi:MAG: (E)-4-hydroxy-3-methylbut-2-enyl-diphosphate synthase [Bacteroidales bacterium]|nr:(E)-4-hydroxy-3-methylbut-2-enyl-diphosphate synthase [Bacteroidales bacterium]